MCAAEKTREFLTRLCEMCSFARQMELLIVIFSLYRVIHFFLSFHLAFSLLTISIDYLFHKMKNVWHFVVVVRRFYSGIFLFFFSPHISIKFAEKFAISHKSQQHIDLFCSTSTKCIRIF